MSDETAERDEIVREVRQLYIGGDGVVLSRERLGVIVGYMASVEAERDAARAELARLREACKGVATSLEANIGYSTGKPDFYSGPEGRDIVRHVLKNAAANLREALGEDVQP